MTGRDDLQRIADEHTAFFDRPPDDELDDWLARHDDIEGWVATHWASDVKIYNQGTGDPVPTEWWVKVHSTQNGYDWRDTEGRVTKVVVGDDAFVLEQLFTPSTSGDGGRRGDPVPVCLVFTVAHGLVSRMDQYWSLSPQPAG